MGTDDKARAKAKGVFGKAKAKLGSATHDERLRREGRDQKSRADLRQAAEKVKDAFKRH